MSNNCQKLFWYAGQNSIYLYTQIYRLLIQKFVMSKNNLLFNALLLILFILCWLIQLYLIFPIESRLLDPAIVQVASVIFIPHGFKVLAATLTSLKALPPLFIGQCIGMQLHTNDPALAVQYGAISMMALYIPVLLINYLERGGKLGLDQTLQPDGSFNLWRKILVVATISSLLNAYLATLLFGSVSNPQLWMRFLLGDVIGAVTVLGTLLIMRRLLIRWHTSRHLA